MSKAAPTKASARSEKGQPGPGLSLLQIVTVSGTVFFTFFCVWALTVSRHAALHGMDSNAKLVPKTQALRGEPLESNQKHIALVTPFVEVVRKAEQLLQRHEALQQLGTVQVQWQQTGRKEANRAIPNPPAVTPAAGANIAADTAARKTATGDSALVLGMAQDTDPKNLIVFCASLRSVTEADAVIFVNTPIPSQHREIASKYRITLKPFDLSSFAAPQQAFHPSTLRWGMMHAYLSDPAVRARYGRVWMADVRDSYFQLDPFAMLPAGQAGFLTFKGVEDKLIRDCGWNGKWIEDCFSRSTYDRVANNQIICSGVSMGDTSSVYEYLGLMSGVISNTGAASQALGSKFPDCERNGVDQGVHNVLVHQKMIPNMVTYDHQSGPVANLQARLSTVRGMEVHNKQNEKVAVVHQYDRVPDLQRALFKKFVYWVDTDNPLAEWAYEPACASFTYKDNFDQFKGVCDMKVHGGTSAAACCQYCKNFPGCVAFTFYSAKCFLKSCSTQSGTAGALPGAVSGALKH